ncbi:MAG: helix-turn-helix transcriptional regulator [Sporichthya sp.]|nr:helix-turn-helix transcriptional regulator [Sporichthya sp.]
MAAARQVLAESGEANLRIGDLTEMADIGFGTFYSHFESKEALVEAVLVEVMASAAGAIGSRALEFPDPAETASFAYRRFIRFAADEPELAAVLTKLDAADDLFETSLLPYARKTLERGISSGRFDIVDIDLALLSVSAAAFAAIKGVLAGRIGPDTGAAGAEMMLRAFGLQHADAREIAHRPMPALEGRLARA